MKFRDMLENIKSLDNKLKKASVKVFDNLSNKSGIENDNDADIKQWVADLLGEYVTMKYNDDKKYEIFNKYVNDIYNKLKKEMK